MNGIVEVLGGGSIECGLLVVVGVGYSYDYMVWKVCFYG